MAVNQPMIGDNQTENSWKLEITNQANQEEARVNSLVTRIDTLEAADASTANTFAFYAYTFDDMRGGVTPPVVQYNNTSVNQGNRFNTTTHLYTAPLNGIYSFNTTWSFNGAVSTVSTTGFRYNYKINNIDSDIYTLNIQGNTSGEHLYGSFPAIISLNQGDTIGVHSNGVLNGRNLTFSGHLIQRTI